MKLWGSRLQKKTDSVARWRPGIATAVRRPSLRFLSGLLVPDGHRRGVRAQRLYGHADGVAVAGVGGSRASQ